MFILPKCGMFGVQIVFLTFAKTFLKPKCVKLLKFYTCVVYGFRPSLSLFLCLKLAPLAPYKAELRVVSGARS